MRDRVQCPVAGECGGCALIGREYEAQLRFKTDRVRKAFAARPELPVERVEPCRPAPVRRSYRNRAKLAVGRSADGVRIGLFCRGTNEIVDLGPCRVQRPALQEALERVRAWLARYELVRPPGPVFYLDLRETADGGCHVTLVLDGDRVDPRALPLDALAADWRGLAGVAVNMGDAASSYAMGPSTTCVRGGETFLASIPAGERSLSFEVPPAGFFQVAPSALPAVHDLMAEHLAGAKALCDLYCGVGVHGLVIASRAAEPTRVFGVEESGPLADAARENAARMGIDASYEVGRVEDRIGDSARVAEADGIILNPGRAGCRPRAVKGLVAVHASKLAYLSCNPDTLARDLVGLLRGGYELTRAVPVDLMPQTDHTEVLTLLTHI
jgi:23S rRNA (uracil1939-C5)-methyltransferase